MLSPASTPSPAQDGWTALISAAKEGHVEVVRELLDHNANLEQRDMVSWGGIMC